MILVFDTFLSEKPLYPDYRLEKLLSNVRDNSYTYRHQPKDLIFLYTILSLKNYPWKKIYINFDCEKIFNSEKIINTIKSEIPYAIINNFRSSTGFEFSKFFQSISKTNDWIFFSPNNDHPYIGSDIKFFNNLIKSAEKAEKKFNKNVSIYYSHFTETINMINKKHYLYFYSGHHYKILEENDFCYTVFTNHQPLESMQIMRKSQLINLFQTVKNKQAIRLESLGDVASLKKIPQILIVPKFECCRHYDGYLHTVNNLKYFITANNVPPLFIPDGFFQKKIKLSSGYLDSKIGYVSLNESAQFYSFENKKNGVDLKINYKDIPDSWAERIEKIDININYQADYNLIKKNKIEILDPWSSLRTYSRFNFIYRFVKIFFFNFFKKIKNIFIKKYAAH